MPEVSDWNAKIVAEFRANEGRVGGYFEGAPMLLLHHRGRTSGKEYIAPVMYLADETDPGTVYVFATNQGGPTNPKWYANLTSAAGAQVEVGAQTYPVDVQDVTGGERDRIYAEQARRYPGFAAYAEKTTGIRTIPVLAAPPAAGPAGLADLVGRCCAGVPKSGIAAGSALRLDQDHQGLGQHAVVDHGLAHLRVLHRDHQSVEVGHVHQHCHLGAVLWVDERADVGDSQGAEDLFALRGGQPVVRVLHVVVANNGWHNSLPGAVLALMR